MAGAIPTGTTTVTLAQKYGMIPFKEDRDFDSWKREIDLWRLVTDLPKEKQGSVLYLSLPEKIRTQLESIAVDDLNKDDGLDTVITKLKELYSPSEELRAFHAYEEFETYRRPNNMSIKDFINEFERRMQKCVGYKIVLGDSVLAYQVLKNANLPNDKRSLALATCNQMTYQAMKKQIKTIFEMDSKKGDGPPDDTTDILVESSESVYYGNNFRGNRGGFRGGARGGRGGRNNTNRYNNNSNNNYNNNYGFNNSGNNNNYGNHNYNNNNNSNNRGRGNFHNSNRARGGGSQSGNWRVHQNQNMINHNMNYLSINDQNMNNQNMNNQNLNNQVMNNQSMNNQLMNNQLVNNQMMNNQNMNNQNMCNQNISLQLFTSEVEVCFLEQMVSETLNSAIVDSGCNKSVSGQNWLACYTDTLPEGYDLEEKESENCFQFGPSKVYPSLKQVNLPVNLGGLQARVSIDVVEAEVPFLLSKSSLKAAEAVLDFVKDTLVVKGGREIQLEHTSNGHYAIPIAPKQLTLIGDNNNKDAVFVTHNPTLVYLNNDQLSHGNLKKKRAIAKKLHLQFGHPVDSKRLKDLCEKAGVTDQILMKLIDEVTASCNTCSRFRKAKLRPVVSLPMASDFNEILALDLKFITNVGKTFIILHMIDIFTRYSAGVIVKSKDKHVIVQSILKHWVAIFGTPISLFSDNGGEFNNGLLRDVAELLNTKVIATAAYSPWSNGIVERHNAVIENMISKTIHDTNCSVETALLWSLCAKNSLLNNRGYSPNQLVFGRNPNLPSVLTSKLPAMRTDTPSKLISEHLSAIAAARQSFIQSEASCQLKKALSSKTRTVTNKVFQIGDEVLYKRPDSKEWHGPGTIFGINGSVAIVRHGGSVISVHPCYLLPYKEEHRETVPASKQKSKKSCRPRANEESATSEVYATIDLSEIAGVVSVSQGNSIENNEPVEIESNTSGVNENVDARRDISVGTLIDIETDFSHDTPPTESVNVALASDENPQLPRKY